MSNFDEIDDSDGHVAADIYPYSYLAYIHGVRSPMFAIYLGMSFYIISVKMVRVHNY